MGGGTYGCRALRGVRVIFGISTELKWLPSGISCKIHLEPSYSRSDM